MVNSLEFMELYHQRSPSIDYGGRTKRG